MERILFCLCLVIFTYSIQTSGQVHFLSDEFIESVNSQATTWQAGKNFDTNLTLQYLKTLTGTILGKPRTSPLLRHDEKFEDLPEEFDARKQWPHCRYIGHIRDQGGCGSCWAFGGVTAMTDRICISSGAKKQPYLSAQDVVSCSEGNGCFGGELQTAWEYWVSDGIVTGGDYNSQEGCRPYEINSTKVVLDTPPCKLECREGYNVSYKNDKNYGSKSYDISGIDQIKAELFKNGPVEGGFMVYEDFLHYKNGVYHHVGGGLLGGHAIKILGWGVENDIPYWLVANSWGSTWGDDGFFKIRRGTNECGIEEQATAGTPKL